jgi:hypothetical protein
MQPGVVDSIKLEVVTLLSAADTKRGGNTSSTSRVMKVLGLVMDDAPTTAPPTHEGGGGGGVILGYLMEEMDMGTIHDVMMAM